MNTKKTFYAPNQTEGFIPFFCLTFLFFLLLFATTASWMQILFEENHSSSNCNLMSQSSTIVSNIIEHVSFKTNFSSKRYTQLLRKSSYKILLKEIQSNAQILQETILSYQRSQPNLSDRSFSFFNLSILSSKHHPPTKI